MPISVTYQEYLASPAWRRRRQAILRRDHWACRCGQPATEVHHLTYARIGNEAPDDLIAVCSNCHTAIHDHAAGTLRERTLAIVGASPVTTNRTAPLPVPPVKARKPRRQSPNPNSKRSLKKARKIALQRAVAPGALRREMQAMKQRNAARDAARALQAQTDTEPASPARSRHDQTP